MQTQSSLSPAFRRPRLLAAILLIAALLAGLLNPQPAQAAPAWQVVGTLVTARSEHSLTLLPNGKVLAVGGNAYVETAELFDPATGLWTATGSLAQGRYQHSAVLLHGIGEAPAQVLVVGGFSGTTVIGSAELYDIQAGTWSSTGALHTARRNHTATVLPNGKVLVVGGNSSNSPSAPVALASVELYDLASGTWDATTPDPLHTARYLHTATLLADGKVLVAGGVTGPSAYTATAEVYDPATNTWTVTANDMASARSNHSATRLYTGKVLVAGGYAGSTGGYPDNTELYDPATNQWSPAAGAMKEHRSMHGAVLLPNGYVLVAGGYNGVAKSSAEIYDPATGWSLTSALSLARYHLPLVLLPSGTVLAAGGYTGGFANTSEIYANPGGGSWASIAAKMTVKRHRPTATLRLDGKVLVAGGYDFNPHASAAVYDPTHQNWTGVADMNTARWHHTATLLPGPADTSPGNVLVVGGRGETSLALDSVELYDYDTNAWIPKAALNTARYRHTATLLPEGRILVTGGTTTASDATNSSEIYDPVADAWTVGPDMDDARYRHTATLLPDGRVLVAGGTSETGISLGSAEIYDPIANTWTPADTMGSRRAAHAATLLPGGRVLITGGYTTSSTATNTAEVYDPVADLWAYVESMAAVRVDHSATLLLNGRVMVAGGYDPTGGTLYKTSEVFDPGIPPDGAWTSISSPLAYSRSGHAAVLLPSGLLLLVGGPDQDSAEVYNLSMGYQSSWQPTITTPTSPFLIQTAPAVFSGTGLTGYQLIEGSSGGPTNAASNHPLVQLRRIENGQTTWFGLNKFVASSISAQAVGLPAGPAMLTVFVNGIPSLSRPIQVLQPVSLAMDVPGATYYPQSPVLTVTAQGVSGQPVGVIQLSVDGGPAVQARVTRRYNATPPSGYATFTLNAPVPGVHSLAFTFPRQGYQYGATLNKELRVSAVIYLPIARK